MSADYRQAVSAYCAADHEQRADLAYRIGWMFTRLKEREAAASWIRQAARLGHARAKALADSFPEPERALAATACGPTVQTAALPSAATMAATAKIVRRVAKQYGLDPNLVLAVITAESRFDANAVSPKNAQGLMQLVPPTAERFKVSDPFDPADNIRGGVRYLALLLKTFGDDLPMALAAYNAGENAVRRHGGIPPYAETQTYVGAVQEYYRQLTERDGDG